MQKSRLKISSKFLSYNAWLVFLALCAFYLSGCGTTRHSSKQNSTPTSRYNPASPAVIPKNQNNACAIFRQKPLWFISAYNVYKKWQVPINLQLAFIWQESRFIPNARPLKKKKFGKTVFASSALGYSQAINSTWHWYTKENQTSRAIRTDFRDAVDFIGWYIDKSRKVLKIPYTDSYNHYLAYHEGHGGFKNRTYRKKRKLNSSAQQVEEKSRIYREQLVQCGLMPNHSKKTTLDQDIISKNNIEILLKQYRKTNIANATSSTANAPKGEENPSLPTDTLETSEDTLETSEDTPFQEIDICNIDSQALFFYQLEACDATILTHGSEEK